MRAFIGNIPMKGSQKGLILFHSDLKKQLRNLCKKWLDENGSPKEISDALNQFRLQVALNAYGNSLDDTGRYWEAKWRRCGGQFIALGGGTKGAIIRNLAVRASYKILGCRRGVLFLIWLRKMIDYCENNIPRTPVGNKL